MKKVSWPCHSAKSERRMAGERQHTAARRFPRAPRVSPAGGALFASALLGGSLPAGPAADAAALALINRDGSPARPSIAIDSRAGEPSLASPALQQSLMLSECPRRARRGHPGGRPFQKTTLDSQTHCLGISVVFYVLEHSIDWQERQWHGILQRKHA